MHTRMCVCLINKRACVRTHEPSYYDVMIVSKGGRIDWSLRCDPPPPSLNHAAMSPRHGSIRAISASSSMMCRRRRSVPYTILCVLCVSISLCSYDISNWLTLIRTMNAVEGGMVWAGCHTGWCGVRIGNQNVIARVRTRMHFVAININFITSTMSVAMLH